jgi:hypothetical protein
MSPKYFIAGTLHSNSKAFLDAAASRRFFAAFFILVVLFVPVCEAEKRRHPKRGVGAIIIELSRRAMGAQNSGQILSLYDRTKHNQPPPHDRWIERWLGCRCRSTRLRGSREQGTYDIGKIARSINQISEATV